MRCFEDHAHVVSLLRKMFQVVQKNDELARILDEDLWHTHPSVQNDCQTLSTFDTYHNAHGERH